MFALVSRWSSYLYVDTHGKPRKAAKLIMHVKKIAKSKQKNISKEKQLPKSIKILS